MPSNHNILNSPVSIIDTGNDSLKAVRDEKQYRIIPHSVAFLDKEQWDSLVKNLPEVPQDFISFTYGNTDFYFVVGETASRLPGIHVDLAIRSERYTRYGGAYYLALIYRSLASLWSGFEKDALQNHQIVVSYPVNDSIYMDKVYETLSLGKPKRKELLRNVTHTFTAGSEKYAIPITKIYQIPEIVGGYSFARLSKLPNSIQYSYSNGNYLVIDTGGGTTQVAGFSSNGSILRSISEEIGIRAVIESFYESVKKRFLKEEGKSLSAASFEMLRNWFINSKLITPTNPEGYDLSAEKRSAIDPLLRVLSTQYSTYFNNGAGYSGIFLTSGAAEMIKTPIQTMTGTLGNNFVMTVKEAHMGGDSKNLNPQLTNAMGMYLSLLLASIGG